MRDPTLRGELDCQVTGHEQKQHASKTILCTLKEIKPEVKRTRLSHVYCLEPFSRVIAKETETTCYKVICINSNLTTYFKGVIKTILTLVHSGISNNDSMKKVLV